MKTWNNKKRPCITNIPVQRITVTSSGIYRMKFLNEMKTDFYTNVFLTRREDFFKKLLDVRTAVLAVLHWGMTKLRGKKNGPKKISFLWQLFFIKTICCSGLSSGSFPFIILRMNRFFPLVLFVVWAVARCFFSRVCGCVYICVSICRGAWGREYLPLCDLNLFQHDCFPRRNQIALISFSIS